MCAVFIASCYGIDLTIGQMATIVLTATLASIGTAGVPGAGMVMLAMVLHSVNIPVEGIALVAGIDRIFDIGAARAGPPPLWVGGLKNPPRGPPPLWGGGPAALFEGPVCMEAIGR